MGSSILDIPTDTTVENAQSNSNYNFIPDEIIRMETAKQLAMADAGSWQAHSKAQDAMRDGDKGEYARFMGQFVLARTIVEKLQFKLTDSVAPYVAGWLGQAAQYHDTAEEIQDGHATGSVEEEWRNVQDALTTRYLLMSLSKHVSESDFLSKVQGISTNSSPKEALGRIHQLFGDKLSLEKLIELQELSELQGALEVQQWQTHHVKDYVGFGDATQKLLTSFTYPEETVTKATGLIIAACKFHDSVEDPNNTVPAGQLWQSAAITLVQYYATLLSK